MFRIPCSRDLDAGFAVNISNQNQTDMAILTYLIKESLKGKLSNQIRASLEAEDNGINEATKILNVLQLPKKLSLKTFRYLPYVDLEYVAKAVDKLFLEAFGIPWIQLDKLYYTKMRTGAFDKNFRQYFGWHNVEHIGDLSSKDFKDGGASFSFWKFIARDKDDNSPAIGVYKQLLDNEGRSYKPNQDLIIFSNMKEIIPQ